MIGSCNDSTQSFPKAICSICYEDLKPIVEDLQAISICGHVFHELCIQQRFGYSLKKKKKCPICKQKCSASNVTRLYFQSVGDSNDPNFSKKLQTHKEDPEELKLEIRRLEGKISRLNLALESRENDLINITDELSVCKEQLKTEALLKNEAMEQTNKINNLLNLKTHELDLECIKLQEKNIALAKELAALKLEKIQKMDITNEMKDNEVLRALKASNNTKDSLSIPNAVDLTRNEMCTPQDTIKEPDVHHKKTKRSRVTENTIKSNNKEGVISYILIDDDAPKVSISAESPSYYSVPQATNFAIADDDMACGNEIGQDKPLTNITKEVSLPDLISQEAAEVCFLAGLPGPDGTKRHLGKWCKKSRNKVFNASSISTQSSGDR
ncbi:hypothetical protein SSX86_027246 [Deinandra increscens subsp. villosa]|uniref:RING-type domain-containing protein n=1 Tax=Deinandra increscens subsp. villosa TaxID=3103831 RepID=A0AAP0GPT0_9ASTR